MGSGPDQNFKLTHYPAVACIREGHTRSGAEIRRWMSGDICRRAGYPQTVAAMQAAAERTGST